MSFPSRSRSRHASLALEPSDGVSVARPIPERRRSGNSSRVLNQQVFRDALLRERKRGDRFEEGFVLALIALETLSPSPSQWCKLTECLSHSTLDTDVIGWFDSGTVLGLIRVLGDVGATRTAADVAAELQRDVNSCLNLLDDSSRCSIRLEVHSPHSSAILPVVFGDRLPRPDSERSSRKAAKRALDIVGSSALLVTLGPVFLTVAVLVRLSSRGPVFFRQQRVGQGGQPFPMLKFRTMQVNADPKIHQQYVEQFIQNRETPPADKPTVWKIVDDPRVTRIGRFLRRSSLDELPQFWNVLKGEMSLVGPRPPLPYEVKRYKVWHRRRVLEAKPGITGLWQVTGRSRTTFDEMVRLDLRYANSHSLWTDLKILIATPRVVLSGKGAH